MGRLKNQCALAAIMIVIFFFRLLLWLNWLVTLFVDHTVQLGNEDKKTLHSLKKRESCLLQLYFCITIKRVFYRVENIFRKGSLDLIPSPLPSVRIQIMGGKGCLRCKGKTLLGIVNTLLKTKKNVDITQQCFALFPQVNFPASSLNFHRR